MTNQYWFEQVNQDAVEVPAWIPLEEMHPCDFQSSMLKGCTPVPNASDPDDFYAEKQVRQASFSILKLEKTVRRS